MSPGEPHPAPCFRLREVARSVAVGAVIAYPTEAVYGLGCDPWDARAVRRILEIKRRPEHKGLILIAADFSQLEPFVEPLEASVMSRIWPTWPGPVTWLLPARSVTPHWLTGRHDTLAVRVTAHPLAAALCRTAGPLVSTSANRGGHPPARSALQVRLRLDGDVDDILAGDCGGRAQPSTIRDGRTGEVIRG